MNFQKYFNLKFKAKQVQGLRSTGSGRVSRAIISRQNRRKLLVNDQVYRHLYEKGIYLSYKQYSTSQRLIGGKQSNFQNTVANLVNNFNQGIIQNQVPNQTNNDQGNLKANLQY